MKKKPKRRIKSMNPKRAAIEVKKVAAYSQIIKQYCAGCGTNQRLSHAHIIPRRTRPDLIADPENINLMCMGRCHEALESNRFWILQNGKELIEYMLKVDFSHAMGRIFRMRDRLIEEEINTDDLPEWVNKILKLIA